MIVDKISVEDLIKSLQHYDPKMLVRIGTPSYPVDIKGINLVSTEEQGLHYIYVLLSIK